MLHAEHDELHAQLVRATRVPGVVGEAALEAARLIEPHLAREEELAQPALALLADVVRGAMRAEMADVIPVTRRLKAELPAMFDEHRQIVAALETLGAAARRAGLAEYEALARSLIRHARLEEQILYPAAILLGQHLERVLQEDVSV